MLSLEFFLLISFLFYFSNPLHSILLLESFVLHDQDLHIEERFFVRMYICTGFHDVPPIGVPARTTMTNDRSRETIVTAELLGVTRREPSMRLREMEPLVQFVRPLAVVGG